ncbi:MAG TPA: glycerol-3-phosphate 1-O-acyltransferase PlsY [Rhizomicrobium sp.]|nr:glycerol-3-phosphate 1-O-acyltransferase PlsY [Rhizomicrobium sp.]
MFDFVHPISWPMQGPYYLGAILFGYLLGSIPFGLIFSYLAGAGDVRKIGSGSTGATNVLRTGKIWAAAATVICDAGKGAAAVIVVRMLYGTDMAMFAGFGALIGHIYPVWLGFKGGKGVATACGILLAVYWPACIVLLAVWLLMLAVFRISSLSALTACVAAPAVMILFHQPLYATLTLIMALVILFAHRANIARLLRGEEPRIGANR